MLRARLRLCAVVFGVILAATLQASQPALAIVHLAEIHEVMVGFEGDPDVQLVEVNMRLSGQHITINSTLATFDDTGAFIDADPGTGGDQPLLTMPANVPNSGNGVRWLLGTADFETASGIQANFEFPANPGLPTGAGMVCLFEAARDFTNPSQSIDCVAYGGAGFTGQNPNSSPSEAATTGPGDGTKSLTRIVSATLGGTPPWARSDDANDFALRCPTPQNNAGQVALMGADDDSDGLPNCHEVELGTDPSIPDSDSDGCTDGKEVGLDETEGGRRDPLNPWDFYDVLGGGAALPKDKLIDLPNDILGVILRYSPSGAPPYDASFDRGPAAMGGDPWDMSAPDGVIDLANDILGVILQYQHDCR